MAKGDRGSRGRGEYGGGSHDRGTSRRDGRGGFGGDRGGDSRSDRQEKNRKAERERREKRERDKKDRAARREKELARQKEWREKNEDLRRVSNEYRRNPETGSFEKTRTDYGKDLNDRSRSKRGWKQSVTFSDETGATTVHVDAKNKYAGRNTGLTYEENKALHLDDAQDWSRQDNSVLDDVLDSITDTWNDYFGEDEPYSEAEKARLRGRANNISKERLDEITDNVRGEEAAKVAAGLTGTMVGGLPGQAINAAKEVIGEEYESEEEQRYAADLRDAVEEAQTSGLTGGLAKVGLTLATGNPLVGNLAVSGYDTYAMNSALNEALSPEARAARESMETPERNLDRGRREHTSRAPSVDIAAIMAEQRMNKQQGSGQIVNRPQYQTPLFQDPLQGMYENIYGQGQDSIYGVSNMYGSPTLS